jgi:inositol phosphorylceramide mannosyltransferase catalytic subunit
MDDLSFEDIDTYLLSQRGKIIHQIWFGTIPNKKKAKKAFESLKKYRDSWLIKNPDWTYICWNLDRCDSLIFTHYPEHREMYEKYPYQIQKCDAVRYFILHRYGGIYADMDYHCIKSFTEVLQRFHNPIYLVETPNKVSGEAHVSNSLMYSSPNHVFWKKLFIEMEKNRYTPYYYGRHLTIMFTTGPGILNRVYNRYKIRFRLDHFPYKKFHPLGLTTENIECKDVYAIHMGKGSWETNDSKFLIFIYTEYKILLFILGILCIAYILSNI